MPNPLNVDVQYSALQDKQGAPSASEILGWAKKVYSFVDRGPAELSLLIVDEKEGRELNQQYRNKREATNVLSFSADAILPNGQRLLGDIVICAPVVESEAKTMGKSSIDHWAHMVVHGMLHLLGYDHIEENEAKAMEALEVTLLAKIGVPNPYNKEES